MLKKMKIWVFVVCFILCSQNVSDGIAQSTHASFLITQVSNGIQTGAFSNGSYTLRVGYNFLNQAQELSADFNADGVVNFSDFLLFAAGYGLRSTDSKFDPLLDLNRDGEVGFADFLIFALAFNT